MKIGYLGAGAWGFCLAHLLASNGHEVILWSRDKNLIQHLKEGKEHPNLKGFTPIPGMTFTHQIQEVAQGVDFIVESVTAGGMRSVFENLKGIRCPIILTSKGIEQKTHLLLSEVLMEILGEESRDQIGCLSGPSLALETLQGLPTSVVASAYNSQVRQIIVDAFSSPRFRVYPNGDMMGVQFGGAMKNIIAIACGMSDSLGFGSNTKSAIMTRGLHEIRKLSLVKGCHPETLNGLAGMGDLCVTCMSVLSRNYRFGSLLGQGSSVNDSKHSIGMAVEGAYTCVSAHNMGKKFGISLPITETIYQVIHEGLDPKEGVHQLMTRVIKEEHL